MDYAQSRRASTWIIVLAALAVGGFILWSLWAELDQIARARGTVIPTGRVQVIQSADGGVITRIRVREGDAVRKGQLLVSLDKVKLGASVDEARARVAALKSAMARIQAELFGRPLAFPDDVQAYPEFVANQRQLYAQRRASLGADIAALQSQGRLIREELNLNMPLVRSGDVARSEIIRMQRNAADVDGQVASRRARYLQDLQAEYAKTQEDLVTAEQLLTQRADALGNADLLSPADGVVKNVRVTTVGGVLRPGDEMLTIVPTGDALIVEAKVAPADIAFVRVGQTASVKFDAYDNSVYGVGTGRVTFISPDTLVEERPGAPADTYYRVHLAVDTAAMRARRAGETIAIQPGMTATVEIKTGESTVFRYLTKPITKTTAEALGER
ncbi:HlyD family type I secretion periplasmic adaptor subunit [Sphingomonas flavalba]|uniref:HlyD family type I secretion periplasmic adaptor subunit n=1 Tax=Sphingomonas flavalba TaxID=2559804 RepID=UPI00109D8544|nr:HlyD family type I secretion periplasmic adaptor subunit [Sphingomonas flavalba]